MEPRWQGYGKDTNCSSDFKVSPDEQADPKLLPRKHISHPFQHFGVPETCLIPKPCLHHRVKDFPEGHRGNSFIVLIDVMHFP